MKKIAVRKAGTVRLTSAAASAYCCGTGTIIITN
jgi:ribosomal protein S12